MRSYTLLFWVTAVLMIVWPRYWLFATPLGTAASPYSIANLLAIFLFLALLFVEGRSKLLGEAIEGNRWIFIAYLTWVAWRLLSDVSGQTPIDSLGATFRSIVYRESILFLGLIIVSRRSFSTLTLLLLLICVGEGLLAIYQRSTEQTLASMMHIDFSAQSDTAAALAVRLTLATYREGQFRVASSFSHPIVFAQFMAAMAPVALHAIRAYSGLRRTLGVIALPMIAVAIVVSGARSGVIVAAVAVFIYLALLSMGNRASIGKVVLALCASLAIGFVLTVAFRSVLDALVVGQSAGEQSSSLARDNMLSIGLYALSRGSYFGFGDGRSIYIAGIQATNDFVTIDNYYLSTALDFGVIGVLINIWLYYLIIISFIRGIAAETTRSDRDFYRAMTAASIGILVGQYVLSMPDNLSMLYLFATLSMSFGRSWRRVGTEASGRRKMPGRLGPAGGIRGNALLPPQAG